MISPIVIICISLGALTGMVWVLVDMMKQSNKELERIRHVLIDIKLKL